MLGATLVPVVVWMLLGAAGGHLIARGRDHLRGLGAPLGALSGPLAGPLLLRAEPPRRSGTAEVAFPSAPLVVSVGVGPSGSGDRPDRVHPDVVAALQSRHWSLRDGHFTCRPHGIRYCEPCARALG